MSHTPSKLKTNRLFFVWFAMVILIENIFDWFRELIELIASSRTSIIRSSLDCAVLVNKIEGFKNIESFSITAYLIGFNFAIKLFEADQSSLIILIKRVFYICFFLLELLKLLKICLETIYSFFLSKTWLKTLIYSLFILI